MIMLYSQDTPPDCAAQISADRNEIVHIDCSDEESGNRYARNLMALLDDADIAEPSDAPVEVWGDYEGAPVRISITWGG